MEERGEVRNRRNRGEIDQRGGQSIKEEKIDSR